MFLLATVQMILHYLGWGGIVFGVIAILFSNPERGFELIIGGIIFLAIKYALGFLFLGAKAATTPKQSAPTPIKKEQKKAVLKKRVTLTEEQKELFGAVVEGVSDNQFWYGNGGVIASLMGDIETARDIMDQCMIKEDYADAMTIATQLGDSETASEALEEFEAWDGGVTSAVGVSAAEGGFTDKAKEAIEKIRDEDLLGAGYIASKIGDKETARLAIDAILAEKEDKDNAFQGLDNKLALSGEMAISIGDKVRLKKALDKLLKMDKPMSTGELAARAGDKELAKKMAAKLKEEYNYSAVGVISAILGDFEETKKSIQKALKEDATKAIRPTIEYLEFLAKTPKA